MNFLYFLVFRVRMIRAFPATQHPNAVDSCSLQFPHPSHTEVQSCLSLQVLPLPSSNDKKSIITPMWFSPPPTSKNDNLGGKRSCGTDRWKISLFLEYFLFLTTSKNSNMLTSDTQVQGGYTKVQSVCKDQRRWTLVGNYRWQQWKRKQARWFLRTAEENSVTWKLPRTKKYPWKFVMEGNLDSGFRLPCFPLPQGPSHHLLLTLLESVLGHGW